MSKITNSSVRKRIAILLEKKIYPLIFIRDLMVSIKWFKHEVKAAHDNDISVLTPDYLEKYKAKNNKEAFFVLGGAMTINELTELQWGVISGSRTVGLNNWFVHEFEPTFLLVEGYREADVGTDIYRWKIDNLASYMTFSKSTLLLNNIARSYLPWSDIAAVCSERTFSFPCVSIPGRTNESKKKAMRMFYKFLLHKKWPMFSRVSVTQAIYLGYILGYKKIVLCGIDLNDGKYFWELPDFIGHECVELPPRTGQTKLHVHSTVDPEVNEVTADRVIFAMNEEILSRSGVRLYVASKKSRLYPEVPLYDF